MTKTQDWICTHCQTTVLAIKKRCGQCQRWRGGVRLNLQKKTVTTTGVDSDDKVVNKGERKSPQIVMSKRKSSHGSFQSPSKSPSLKQSIKNSSTIHGDPTKDWICTHCQTTVLAIKKRCGQCQRWRGGVRLNIQKKTVSSVKSAVGKSASKKVDGTEKKNHAILDIASKGITVPASAFAESTIPNGECNLDDVACCLCKCAVDFGDDFFFLPEETQTLKDGKEKVTIIENGNQCTLGGPNGEDVAINTEKEECKPSAIVSSDVSVAEASDESSASPKTVIHPKNEADAVITQSSPMNRVENVEKDASCDISNIDLDERKPSPLLVKSTEEASDDGSEETKPPFQLPRRFYNPGNSLILCDGPEYAPRKKNGSGSIYRCERAYHQLCHFIPGEDNSGRYIVSCLVCTVILHFFVLL